VPGSPLPLPFRALSCCPSIALIQTLLVDLRREDRKSRIA
jgi:hypothetical protein